MSEIGADDKAFIINLKAKIEAELANMEKIKKQLDDVINSTVESAVDKTNAELSKKRPGVLSETPESEGTFDKDRAVSYMQKTNKLLSTIADVGSSLIKTTLGFVQSIYNQLKKSGPLLQAVEQLFTLAWTLFFMPLGNKLGEILIPAVIQMMDNVMAIWDAFEGMTLGEMFSYAVEVGVKMIADFLTVIGDELADEKGLVGAVGRMLQWIGGFLEDHGEQILETLINLARWILENLPMLIGTLVALKIASIGLQVTQILTTAAAGQWWTLGLSAGGVALAGLATTGVASMIGGSAVANFIGGYAEGGHVPGRAGGSLAIVGEGGEGEWIIPDSKMGAIGGNTYTVNNYMMSTEELDRHIREVIREEVSYSKLRSGF